MFVKQREQWGGKGALEREIVEACHESAAGNETLASLKIKAAHNSRQSDVKKKGFYSQIKARNAAGVNTVKMLDSLS